MLGILEIDYKSVSRFDEQMEAAGYDDLALSSLSRSKSLILCIGMCARAPFF